MPNSKTNNPNNEELSKQLSLLMINMEEPFLLIDKEMIVVTFNESFKKQYEKYFGFEFIKGFSIFNYVQANRTDSLKKIYTEVFEGKHIEMEVESTVSDNTKRLFLNKYKPALNENSEIVGAFISSVDITDKKNAEEKLKQSENNLNAIFNSSSEAFILIDRNCIIKTFNLKADENDYLTTKKIEFGNNLIDYLEPARKEYFQNYITKVLNGEIVEYESKYTPSNNQYIKWFEVTLNPVKEEDTITGICITRRDVTKRKLAQEDPKKSHKLLKELNENLEKRAEELATTNLELEQFAYIASHDLQEPLRMVTSFLNLLELKYKPQLDDKAKQYIYFATDGAVRMRKIILDLLEYSMAGKKGHETEPVNMNELANEAVQLNHKTVEEKNAVIEWINLPTIKVNKTSLQQVFQNLIANALKYQKINVQPVIKIVASETKMHWQFSFTDNGIGIDTLFFEKIFIVFQRLHNKDEYSGTGLGLAICKKIIENHNGKIWVESELDKGSTFYFTIAK